MLEIFTYAGTTWWSGTAVDDDSKHRCFTTGLESD